MGILSVVKLWENKNVCRRIALITVVALSIYNIGAVWLLEMFGQNGLAYSVQAAEIGLDVSYHTQDQIRAKIDSSGVGFQDDITFDEEPVYQSPYKLGKISEATKKSSIAMLNNIRYVAGLQDTVTWDDSYGEYAQAAALVSAANDSLSHYPAKPSGMDDTLYKKGQDGAGSSNLASGYSSLNQALLGWMDDGDPKNIDCIGHRRWILNPPMGKTGLGSAGDYAAIYAFDYNGNGNEKRVAWPAQQMPIEFFGSNYPWSLSVDEDISKTDVSVQLTRIDDGKVWRFNNETNNNAVDSGYFNVDSGHYGQTSCVIFRPNVIKYSAGQKFEVLIKGIEEQDIRYTVEFFNLNIAASDEKPEGLVESYKRCDGGFTIKGWSYDKNDISKAITIQIYIGGDRGNQEAEIHTITANKLRTDIGDTYDCGNYHGFEDTIYTNKSGQQVINIYAINIGGSAEDKILSSRELYISGKSETQNDVGISEDSSFGNSRSSDSLGGIVGYNSNSSSSNNSGSVAGDSNNSLSSYDSNSSAGHNSSYNNDDDDDESESETSNYKTITLPTNGGKISTSYQVTGKKATFIKVTKKASSVTIPAVIEYDNKRYKVTEIESEAFKGRSKVNKIKLDAKNIQDVGYEAFKGIKKNATITISAKTKKRYNRLVKMIKESGIKKVNFVFKKK